MRLRVNADFDAVRVAEIFLSLVSGGSIPKRGCAPEGSEIPPIAGRPKLPKAPSVRGQVLTADRGAFARDIATLNLRAGDSLYLHMVFDEKFNEIVVGQVIAFQTFLAEQGCDGYSGPSGCTAVVDEKVDEIAGLGHDLGLAYQVSLGTPSHDVAGRIYARPANPAECSPSMAESK